MEVDRMVANWKVKRQVDEFVELLAVSPVEQFYPTSIPKYTSDVSLEAAFDYLLKLCETGELQLLWEVKCPGDDIEFCLRRLDIAPDYHKVLNKDYSCDICGRESCVDKNHIFPVFKISDDYRNYLRQEFKKKTESPGRLRLKINSKV
jgi:hypothetical protein